jgi:hypothetical protein
VRFTNPLARWRQRELLRELSAQISRVEEYLGRRPANTVEGASPVIFFNASTRIHRLSLNGAFSLLASWGLRAAGQEVKYLVCHSALSPCVLGTDRRSPEASPPCRICLDLSTVLFPPSAVIPLTQDLARTSGVLGELRRLPLEALAAWEQDGLPLGELTLPSLRWVLHRHRLADSAVVRSLYAGYIASALTVARQVRTLLAERKPRAMVLFNGIFYPEAVARRVAEEAGLPVITHEVGLQAGSAFFSHREATFREVELPEVFPWTAEQQGQLDEVLGRRFRGEFTMAGVQFWPEMKSLPASLVEKRRSFRQLVSVFTNVVFDTSQVHANVLFDDMFEWLDALAGIIRKERDTLFVIRAHPDESRRGKESQESVRAWVKETLLDRLANVVFVGPEERLSSYELIRASKFVLVYNSSVGLEALILGTPALSAGRARFTQMPTTTFPASRSDYLKTLEAFMAADRIDVTETQSRNARTFLYYELFHASLDLSEFLVTDPRLEGMVRFSNFAPARLAEADIFRVLREGILEGKPFVNSGRPILPHGGAAT